MSTSEKLGPYTYVVIGMIIGVYRDGQQPGNCRARVEEMRDYLKNSGYWQTLVVSAISISVSCFRGCWLLQYILSQGRRQEFTKGDKPRGLGDGSLQRDPGAEYGNPREHQRSCDKTYLWWRTHSGYAPVLSAGVLNINWNSSQADGLTKYTWTWQTRWNIHSSQEFFVIVTICLKILPWHLPYIQGWAWTRSSVNGTSAPST